MSLYEIDHDATQRRLDAISVNGLRALGECTRRAEEIDKQIQEMRASQERERQAIDELVKQAKRDKPEPGPAAKPSTLALGAEEFREAKQARESQQARQRPDGADPASHAPGRDNQPHEAQVLRANQPNHAWQGGQPRGGNRPNEQAGGANDVWQAGSQPGGRDRRDAVRPSGGYEAWQAGRGPGGARAGGSDQAGGSDRPGADPARDRTGGLPNQARHAGQPDRNNQARPGPGTVRGGNQPAGQPRGTQPGQSRGAQPSQSRGAQQGQPRGPQPGEARGPAAKDQSSEVKQPPVTRRTLMLGAPEDRDAGKAAKPPAETRKSKPPRPADGDDDLSGRTWLR